MKRVIICIVLLAGILTLTFYSTHKITSMEKNVVQYIDSINAALERQDRDAVVRQVNELHSFWESEEKTLMHFVRHGEIDGISFSIARLPALADWDSFADLASELASVRRQAEHIRNSEAVSPGNIL